MYCVSSASSQCHQLYSICWLHNLFDRNKEHNAHYKLETQLGCLVASSWLHEVTEVSFVSGLPLLDACMYGGELLRQYGAILYHHLHHMASKPLKQSGMMQ